MRKTIEPQLQIGQIDIPNIQFDLNSRDEIPKVLIGLQSLYCDRQARTEIFAILNDLIGPQVSMKKGRRGMDLWRILVLGVIRLACDWDYDKLQEIANNHRTLRLMLGHGPFDAEYRYALQTIKDNVSLFTSEIIERISQVAVQHGHAVFGKKADEPIHASCDSFPVQTDVHFPTDTNLLLDAMRKTITLIMALCTSIGIKGWRNGIDGLKKIKRLYRQIQRLKHSASKNPEKKAERERLIVNAHKMYIEMAKNIVEKAKQTLCQIAPAAIEVQLKIDQIRIYIAHAERQIDQIEKRVINGQTIPHHEKVFSIFEEHTEWISKGKAGVLVELGLNVCIVKDQFGMILHHHVMQGQTDDQVAVPVIQKTKELFSELSVCSFDKGFHSPSNQESLAKILDRVVLPRKGKLSVENAAIEDSEEFKTAKRKHASVESAINALEHCGLDRCPDHGIHGFKRYVALAVLARNLIIIGHAVQQKELKHQKNREKLKKVV